MTEETAQRAGLRPLPQNGPSELHVDSSEPRIGAVVLANFTVTLDQRHARLRLAREGRATFELPSPRRAP